MNTAINFPHLGIYLDHVGKSISVFGFDIAYYGITMGLSILLGLYLAEREAKRTGQDPDTYTDLVIYAIVFSIICARAYYVIFSWDNYKDNLLSIFNLRQGGIAIYGAIIGAVSTVYVYSRVKKLSFLQMVDTACIGLVAGQILGRWGNFFNREAFGGYTDGLFAMQLPVSAVRAHEKTKEMWAHVQIVGGEQFIQVHPTFLYECLWNLGVICFLLFCFKFFVICTVTCIKMFYLFPCSSNIHLRYCPYIIIILVIFKLQVLCTCIIKRQPEYLYNPYKQA